MIYSIFCCNLLSGWMLILWSQTNFLRWHRWQTRRKVLRTHRTVSFKFIRRWLGHFEWRTYQKNKIYPLLRYCTCTCHINHSSVRRPHDDSHILHVTCADAYHYLLPLRLLFPIFTEVKVNLFSFSRLRLHSFRIELNKFSICLVYAQKCVEFFFPAHETYIYTIIHDSSKTNLWFFFVFCHMLWRLLMAV